MKITQEVREYAEKMELDEKEALEAGMESVAKEFVHKGAELYF